MRNQEFVLQRYDSDEGMVFDWANLEEHMTEIDGEMVQEHLYCKTLYLSLGDDISNYVEVPQE